MELVLSKPKVILLSLFMLYSVSLALGRNDTRVLTQQGYVRGVRQVIQTNRGQAKTIYKFLGVPYARSPIGNLNLRFKPPQALSTQRSSDYDATFLRPVCVQDNVTLASIRRAWPTFDPMRDMDEDCLYLNIYTPRTRGTTKYPVIVYIHGGSYISGTPIRDISPGEYLPTRDVVLVTVQYRLGPFGFFSTGDSEAPGNVGLLDQVEALKWIRDNIGVFGGKKSSVTLLGESAGGSSVGLHYLSPQSRGLFHRGIAVSGVDLSPFAYAPKSQVLHSSKELIRMVNCTRNSSQLVVQCLQTVSTATVFKISDPLILKPFVNHHFLPDNPKILRKQGKFLKFPLIAGFVSQEGSFIVEKGGAAINDNTSFTTYLENIFPVLGRGAVNQSRAAFNALKSQYTPANNDPSEYRRKLVNMWSDYTVIAPTLDVSSYHSANGTATYLFEFAHRSRNHSKPPWMGVVHGDTTAYMFGLPLLRSNPSELTFDDNDRAVSDKVVTMFTNFAKFRNPTPALIPVSGVNWSNFSLPNKAYLKIQSNPVMTTNYHPQRMTFWNSRFPSFFPAPAPCQHVTSQDRVTSLNEMRDKLSIKHIW